MPDVVHCLIDLDTAEDLTALEPGTPFRGGTLLEIDATRQRALVELYPGDELELGKSEELVRKRLVRGKDD